MTSIIFNWQLMRTPGNQGGAFELKSGSNTYSIVSGNKANISSANKVTHFADGETILLVADNSDPDKMTFSAYEGHFRMAHHQAQRRKRWCCDGVHGQLSAAGDPHGDFCGKEC